VSLNKPKGNYGHNLQGGSFYGVCFKCLERKHRGISTTEILFELNLN